MNIKPSKRLSQNFLKDKNIARKISQALSNTENSLVVEIGAGNGILTQFLVQSANKVIAVELDPLLAEDLPVKLNLPKNLQVIQQDFLKIDLKQILALFPHQQVYFIGNIPYHITTPIIFKILEVYHMIHSIVIMVQKEVGERIVSPPGNKSYGILSVFCQTYTHVEYLFTVPAHLFSPSPKVDSAVVRMICKHPSELNISDLELFRKIVRSTFSQRRKMLRNTLSLIFSETKLNRVNFDLTRRPDSLSVSEFRTLTNNIYQIFMSRNHESDIQ
jgi:16S rRNA (adenine1518-N6/adenine1519-N6)-dimethyltransferase